MPLGALTLAWTRVEASMPRGWEMGGVLLFDGEWVAFTDGPDRTEQPISAGGVTPEQALERLANRLRERRGPATG
jgi:hypothetical protein